MYIRCKACHSAVWLEVPEEAGGTAAASCGRCGQEYDFRAGPRPERDNKTLAMEARRLASSHEIDLPAAYSVVLGAMSVADVHAVQSRAVDTAPETGTHDDEARREPRIVYAESIANRYGLPMATAYDVADHRISVLRALWKHPTPATAPVALNPARRTSATLHWAFAGAAVLLLFAVYYGPGPSVPDERRSVTRMVGSAEVRTDAEGRVTLVSARNPRGVLDGYCGADESAQLRALDVVTDANAVRGARLGLFHRVSSPTEVLSIDILENRREQRWFSGDGVRPIMSGRAPAVAKEGILEPAETRTVADVSSSRAER